jgi:anti-anti-sigma factor
LIDARGAEALRAIVTRLTAAGLGVSFSGFAENILDLLERYNLLPVIGEKNIYPTQMLAVRNIFAKAHLGSTEDKCPLEALRPFVAELSLHSDGSFRDARRWRLRKCEFIVALRYDGPLDLAASEYLEQKVEESIAAMPKLKHIFFAAHRINQIDSHGAEVLGRVVKRIQEGGYGVSFSGLSDDMLDMMKTDHLYDLIGEDNIYPTQAVAMEAIHRQAHQDADEEACPLVQVVPETSEEAVSES